MDERDVIVVGGGSPGEHCAGALADLIPEAQIRIYPDAAHAFLFQEPEQVASDIKAFLD